MSLTTLKKLLSVLSMWCLLFVVASDAHETTARHTENNFNPNESPIDLVIPRAYGALNIESDEDGKFRYFHSDGSPDHATGQFPNRNNPNAIRNVKRTYRVAISPTKQASPLMVERAAFGIALNGVIFDPATAEFWGGQRHGEWNFEALHGQLNLGIDQNNAHVQPDGTYHYHGLPNGFIDQYKDYKARPLLLGYAADGYPIYANYGYENALSDTSNVRKLTSSYKIKNGLRPSGPGGRYDGRFTADWEFSEGSGDLDRCNGRTGVTPEYPAGTYYYVITDAFPFIPRCWFGLPDASFQKQAIEGNATRRGRPGPPHNAEFLPQGRRPPIQAVNACRSKSSNETCVVETPHGTKQGNCRQVSGNDLACVPPRPPR
ncbi:MAG: YHYH protein [Pseudomonadota bacterium]